jgi:hypothetical protein
VAIAKKSFRTHQIQGNLVEAIQYMQYAAGQTFLLGELVKDSSGSIIVCGADPASGTIIGVTLQAADTSPGFAAANSPATFTGRSQKVSVSRPNDNTIYQGELTNGSSTVVVPATADLNAQYGVTAYSGIWTVDKSKTGGSARVVVVGIDTDQNVVFFKFIASFLA